MTNSDLEKLVNERLSKKRQAHTRAVAKLSVELAKKYHVSENDTFTAAMLHDITKEIPLNEQLQTIKSSDIINSLDFSKSNLKNDMNSNIYHGITAFLYARDALKLQNTDILNAIRYHTTGRANMSMLEKIIFTSDSVSYDRTYDEAENLRKLAFNNFDECMLSVLKFTVCNLIAREEIICLDTITCYNSLIRGKNYENQEPIKCT